MPYHTILLLGYFNLKINSTFNVTSSPLETIEQEVGLVIGDRKWVLGNLKSLYRDSF